MTTGPSILISNRCHRKETAINSGQMFSGLYKIFDI